MATISEPVSIAHVKDACLKSVTPSYEPKTVTVTYDTKCISVIEVDTQKTQHSWSVRRGQLITSSAIWNENNHFCTVIDGREVKIWSKDELNFDKSKKKHFKFDIHQILALKGYEPIVLCKNGAVDFLSQVKDTHSSGTLNDSDVILQSQAFIIRDKICVISLVQRQNGQLAVTLHKQTIEDSDNCWTSITTILDLPVDIPVCTCNIKQFSDNVGCYVLYKTGALYSITISPLTNDVGTSRLCNVSDLTESVAMVILNSTHIALAGIQREKQTGIGILDTRFDVLHQFKPFSEPIKEKVKIFHCLNSLFVSCGKTLYMYKYSCPRSTVATILGKQRIKTDPQCNKLEKRDTDKRENLRNTLSQLSDITGVTNYKTFSEKFSKVKPILIEEGGSGDIMLQFLHRCLSENKFYPQSEIQFLIEKLLIPTVYVGDLTDTLIRHRDLILLHTMLLHLSNIPESCLCKTLQFILSLDEKDMTKVSPQSTTEGTPEGCPLSTTKALYVNQILQIPFNDVFLVECIKTLTFQNVLLLLEYLFSLLSIGQDKKVFIYNIPSLSQIVDWLCCLLDGHFTQLIISPDARSVLVHLHTEVESKVEFYEELLSLDALLQQLKSKCAIPQNKMVGQYCIELLHIL